MGRFYFSLWVRWVVYVTSRSIMVAAVAALLVAGYLYIQKGSPSLDLEVKRALWNIFVFWFAIFWSASLVFFVFRSVKLLFNDCKNGYLFRLYSCEKGEEYIEPVGYGDLPRVWRRWLLLLVWNVAAEIILSGFVLKLMGKNILDYLDIYLLYAFIMIAGYNGIVFFQTFCKRVRIERC